MYRFSLALFLLAFSQGADACASLPIPEHQAAVERDLRRQAMLVKQLTSESDAVLVADVVTATEESASVKVVEELKGSGRAERRVRPGTRLEAIGCLASASFRNIALQPGKRYVLYLSGDRVLRAGDFERTAENLTVSEELELVLRSLRT